jgi:hypothetical protein
MTSRSKINVSEEIKKIVIAANRSYHGLRKILRSKYITWHWKMRLYKTVIRPVIAYGSEAWVMNICDESMINIFETKILRKIFEYVREGDHWRARYNNELYGLYREQDLVSYIKVERMRWAGHVSRMEDSDPAKQVMEQQLYGTRRAGRPKLRWVDNVSQDARNMGINNWKTAAHDRKRRRKLLAEAKIRQGL